ELNGAEEDAGLPQTRRPDAGFLALAHAWAAGEGLDDVMADEQMSGGDFVRNVKQLIDRLRQIADVAPDRSPRETAGERAGGGGGDGSGRPRRGVVGWEAPPVRRPPGGPGWRRPRLAPGVRRHERAMAGFVEPGAQGASQ